MVPRVRTTTSPAATMTCCWKEGGVDLPCAEVAGTTAVAAAPPLEPIWRRVESE